MSPAVPHAERRSGEVIYPEAFRAKATTIDQARRDGHLARHHLDTGAYAEAGKRWDHVARAEARHWDVPGYQDDHGPWTAEQPTPMARALAAIETGVLTEELLFGGIVLRLPPARSPLRALVRQLAAKVAR